MNLKEALNSNFENKNHEQKFWKFFSKTIGITWLKGKSKDPDIYFELIKAIKSKHSISLAHIQPASKHSYSFMIRNDFTGAWIYTVYCKTISEGLAKTLLIMYAYINKGIKFNDKS